MGFAVQKMPPIAWNGLVSYMRGSVELIKSAKINSKHPYCCIEDFILQHGSGFVHKPLPKRMSYGIPRQCYANSLRRARRSKGRWIYVEGFAMAMQGFPVLHAWLTSPDDPEAAYDVTWREPGLAYFGVMFKSEYVKMVADWSGMYSALDQWEIRYPLLTGEHGPEQALYSLNGKTDHDKTLQPHKVRRRSCA